MHIDLFLIGVLQGLILALVAYALMIPFRLLDFTDLSAEGAYPLGAAVCASLLLIGINSILSIFLAAIVSGLLGVATSLIHLRLRVNSILAGIIVSTMAYSINLRIVGKPNVALFDACLLFTNNSVIQDICIVCCIILVLIIPFILFLRTELGLRFLAVGLNPTFASRQCIVVSKYIIGGLFIANFYTGIAAGLMVNLQSYMDVGMGIGIVIHALAALMIGECLVGNYNLNRQLLAPLVGALLYQQIQGLVLFLGLAPSDLKFLTGTIVLVVIWLNNKNSLAPFNK